MDGRERGLDDQGELRVTDASYLDILGNVQAVLVKAGDGAEGYVVTGADDRVCGGVVVQ